MLVKIILLLAAIYLLLGLLFAIAFVIKGVTTVDEHARGSSIGFRIIILPGAILLWPVLLRKWLNEKSARYDKIN